MCVCVRAEEDQVCVCVLCVRAEEDQVFQDPGPLSSAQQITSKPLSNEVSIDRRGGCLFLQHLALAKPISYLLPSLMLFYLFLYSEHIGYGL